MPKKTMSREFEDELKHNAYRISTADSARRGGRKGNMVTIERKKLLKMMRERGES